MANKMHKLWDQRFEKKEHEPIEACPLNPSYNILMVDDLQENLLALEAVLDASKYHLIMATSSEEALRYTLQYDFSLIILDVHMPKINGLEIARLIKKRKESCHIPILFITTINQDIEYIIKGYKTGAIDYIVKPFHPDILIQKVKEFIEYKDLNQIEEENDNNYSNVWEEGRKNNLMKKEVFSSIIQETLQDTIITFDEVGTIVSVNASIQKMFGYTEEEIVGASIEEVLYSIETNDGREQRITLSFLFQELIGKMLEMKALNKKNQTFPVDIYIGDTMLSETPLFVCTIRDISERKAIDLLRKDQLSQLEQVIEERTIDLLMMNHQLAKEKEERSRVVDHLMLSEGRFQQIFDVSPCLMAICDIKKHRFIAVNNNWVKTTGYRSEELTSERYRWEVMKENGDGIEEKFEKEEWYTPISNQRVIYWTKSGEIRKGLMSTEIIQLQNRQCKLIVLNDMTESLNLKDELARLDRLNLVGEMAAGIAHEIRNPMTTVHGFLQIGKMDPSALQVEHMELMIEELDRANKIIKEFLTLAKNKASDKRPQSLNTIIETIYPLINAEALLTGKKVMLHLGRCPNLLLDEKEIRQLLLNFALNGLEAMDSGGTLDIRTYYDEKYIILEFIDNGIGMDQEVLSKIGTPFYTTKENGTGLGLAVCYRIAERHQAKIQVESSKKGTIFSVYFKE